MMTVDDFITIEKAYYDMISGNPSYIYGERALEDILFYVSTKNAPDTVPDTYSGSLNQYMQENKWTCYRYTDTTANMLEFVCAIMKNIQCNGELCSDNGIDDQYFRCMDEPDDIINMKILNDILNEVLCIDYCFIYDKDDDTITLFKGVVC